MLSNDEAACTLQHGCHWDPKEFECEFGDQPLSHENQYAPQVPTHGQLAPAAPTAAAPGTVPQMVPMPGAPPMPGQSAPAAAAPGTVPQMAPMPGAHPVPGQAPPAAPAPQYPAPAAHAPVAPAAPAHAAPVIPQDCRRLMEPQCFGPSLKTGEVCMY